MSWYLRTPSSSNLDQEVFVKAGSFKVKPDMEVGEFFPVTPGDDGKAIVDTGAIYGDRISAVLRCTTAAQLDALKVLYRRRETLQFEDGFGRSWWVRIVDWSEVLVAVSGSAPFTWVSLTLVEVDAP